jgi:hypothetical protein
MKSGADHGVNMPSVMNKQMMSIGNSQDAVLPALK